MVAQQNLMSSNDPNQQTLEQMVKRVINQKQDWSKHIAHTCCRCEKCTCGKHLCKFQPLKFHLKPTNTTYLQFYTKKEGQNLSQSHRRLKIPTDAYHPQQFVSNSQYKDEYYRKKAKKESRAESQKKNDNISADGPVSFATTYKNSYPPKYGAPAQKIKKADNLVNSPSRMNGTSSYSHQYGWSNRKPGVRQQPSKKNDNLKTANVFRGETSYGQNYRRYPTQPKDQQSFAPQQAYHPSRGLRPKSSYRCDYTGRKTNPCPAMRCPEQKCC